MGPPPDFPQSIEQDTKAKPWTVQGINLALIGTDMLAAWLLQFIQERFQRVLYTTYVRNAEWCLFMR